MFVPLGERQAMTLGFILGAVTASLLAWVFFSARHASLPPKDMPGDW